MGKFLLSCIVALVVSGCHPVWPVLPASEGVAPPQERGLPTDHGQTVVRRLNG